MMDQRFLGGEAGHRSLWGTSTKRTRNVSLALVGVVGLVLVPIFSTPALAVVLLAWGLVFLATTQTHMGTPWERWNRGRQWRERQRAGVTRFRPVERRPAELHAEHVGGVASGPAGTGRSRTEVAQEWNSYRDWADGAEGMVWLLSKPRVPGIAWHAPTGEDPWLSVVFPLSGQVSGIQGDEVVNARSRAFGRLLSVFGSANALARRLQIITHVQPVDTAAHEAWVADEVDPTAPEELLRSYKEVITRLGGGGLMQRHYAVVRWPLTSRFLQQARRHGPGQVGWIKLMANEIDSIWREMNAAKLGPGRALSAAQTTAVLRHLQMPSWPIDQAGDADPQRMWLSSEDEWSFTKVSDTGPDGVEDTWLHRTALVPISTVETAARDALWMVPLLAQLPNQRVVRTVSVQLEGVTQQMARSQAREDLTSDLAEVSAQRSKGTLLNDELLEGVDAARARVGDLRPGKGHQGLAWVMHVTVSAQDKSELRSGCELMSEAASKAGIGSLQWLDAHQAAAQACTWPLARGLKPTPDTAGTRLTGALAGSGPKEALT